MISENALVVYKNKPALVKEKIDGKFAIAFADGSLVKVRDKDIELIHDGPIKNFNGIDNAHNEDKNKSDAIKEAWELLSGEASSLSLKEFSVFIFNEYTPSSAYSAYLVLQDGLYFSGNPDAIVPRNKDEVASEEEKRNEKQRETDDRVRFLNRIKECIKNPAKNPLSAEDRRFIQDIEALAYGKSAKSRTMKELGLGETPQEAHALLLKTGFWTPFVNPHPSRFDLSVSAVKVCPENPPAEDRRDLCRLAAFAIDSPWSNDPDDAVSAEKTKEGEILYVHIADTASSITFNSPAEKEARNRGATLYLPEITARMLSEEALPVFALGMSEKSNALTFKIKIDENGNAAETEVFPSIVKVRRMSYEQADIEMDSETGEALRDLHQLALKIFQRRTKNGAVNISLPEAHISVENKTVKITPHVQYRSAFLVRECMIAAGEGAGKWASSKDIAFPYISQEADVPHSVLSGFAGSMQLRKSMRPRVLSTKPGRHEGLGLDIYTQVTSPLRRYTDLLAHMQIRAFLRGEKPLGGDDLLIRLGYGEAAAVAAVQAERSSNNHWIMVYLSGKKDSVWDAVAIEKKGKGMQVIIPALALETQIALQKDVSPNDNLNLTLKSVNIPKGEAVFAQHLP
ncbi:MAG: ribonuclease catalytic domain-containing protein [Treponema sp.]|nr:ribonuclease catalytic domain-containing protein [Treponema sp.]